MMMMMTTTMMLKMNPLALAALLLSVLCSVVCSPRLYQQQQQQQPLDGRANAQVQVQVQPSEQAKLDPKSDNLAITSRRILFQNCHTPGTLPGTVVASPSKADPDYFFNWIRDAAVTHFTILDMLRDADDGASSTPLDLASDNRRTNDSTSRLESMLTSYAELSKIHQATASIARSGLGEPKFHVNGTPFNGEWGRPQNDGPALRSLALAQFALWLIQHRPDRINFVKSVLFDSKLPTHSVIKTDLEFIAAHWQDPSFDLWEEVYAQSHFYTKLVQHAALVSGAHLALKLDDPGAAAWYERQAKEILHSLANHWDSLRGRIVPTLDSQSRVPSNRVGLDIAVVIASLHAHYATRIVGDVSKPSAHAHDYAPWDERIIATVVQIQNAFKPLYPINSNVSTVVVGRYPEDIYDGVGFSGGNPWPLATCALAEQAFKTLAHWCSAQSIPLTRDTTEYLKNHGVHDTARYTQPRTVGVSDKSFSPIVRKMMGAADAILERVRELAALDDHDDDGSHTNLALSEQWQRTTGKKQGAIQLTWSAVAYLQSLRAQQEAQEACSDYVRS